MFVAVTVTIFFAIVVIAFDNIAVAVNAVKRLIAQRSDKSNNNNSGNINKKNQQ